MCQKIEYRIRKRTCHVARANAHLLTLHKICWQGILWRTILCLVLVISFLVHGNRLFHRCLLSMSLLGQQFTLQPLGLLCNFRPLVHQPAIRCVASQNDSQTKCHPCMTLKLRQDISEFNLESQSETILQCLGCIILNPDQRITRVRTQRTEQQGKDENIESSWTQRYAKCGKVYSKIHSRMLACPAPCFQSKDRNIHGSMLIKRRF